MRPGLSIRLRGVLALAALLPLPVARPAPPPDWPPETAPPAILSTSPLLEWRFADGQLQGWRPDADLGPPGTTAGPLSFQARGLDPKFDSPPIDIPGTDAVFTVRLRARAPGPAQVFWVARDAPGPTEAASSRFDLAADGGWAEYRVTCPLREPLRALRFDPAGGPGGIEIAWIRLTAEPAHPLRLVHVVTTSGKATIRVRNAGDAARGVRVLGTERQIPAGGELTWETVLPAPRAPLERHTLTLESIGLPPVECPLLVLDESESLAPPDHWRRLSQGGLHLDIARDGTCARLSRDGTPAVWLAPLLSRDGAPTPLNLLEANENTARLATPGGDELTFSWTPGGLALAFRAKDVGPRWEGPVVRVPGPLEQALLPGVEHLGKEEHSSSTLDIRGPEHIRHRPPPHHLTMPLMACITPGVSVALVWENAPRPPQPVFAVPNFLDGPAAHRLSLEGSDLRALLHIGPGFAGGTRLEDLILRAIRHTGLPPHPPPPRDRAAQMALNLKGLQESALRDPATGHWYHAILPGVKNAPEQPQPFADHVSTLYRLTGEISPGQPLVPGGAHLENGTAWFLTGQATAWLAAKRSQAGAALRTQQPDGSWRYGGEFRAGHFEDTASGHCALHAVNVLEFARLSGEENFRAAGLRAVEFLRRFRTPRGAQVWECPLHAPDLMASAHATRACLLAYELTGDPAHLAEARRWALSGLPYIYTWDDGRPIMRYASIATLCATHYIAPVWIGRPVQWCGIVYADALLDLAAHDHTLDWHHLAGGILLSAERQQYSEGTSIGLLADSVTLHDQRLHPYDINPCTLVALRLRWEGQPSGLTSATLAGRRLVSPYPVKADAGQLLIQAPPGQDFQILIDGEPRSLSGPSRIDLPSAP